MLDTGYWMLDKNRCRLQVAGWKDREQIKDYAQRSALSAFPGSGNNETGTDSFLTGASGVAGRLLFPSGGGEITETRKKLVTFQTVKQSAEDLPVLRIFGPGAGGWLFFMALILLSMWIAY